MNLRKHFWLMNIITITAVAGLLIFGSDALYLYVIVYMSIFFILFARTFLTRGKIFFKLGLSVIFLLVFIFQVMLSIDILNLTGVDGFLAPIDPSLPSYWPRKFVCTFIIAVPIVISRYVTVGKYAQFYLPSIKEAGSIGFAELKGTAASVSVLAEKAGRTSKSLSIANFREIMNDLPHHDSFNYVNNGTLTEDYFKKAEETLADQRLYIVVSHTGSAASDIISVFTNKNYNHASLAFDRELKTILSYNGGNNVYPPGMNPEMLADFVKKGDASILVYSLSCSAEQKAKVLQQIRDINENGSAYNMLGLVTKRSYRPNIMFCSQFVYRMLELVGLAYFKKIEGRVEPTDFVELDYHRALAFEYEVRL
jgi:hypothetical protein